MPVLQRLRHHRSPFGQTAECVLRWAPKAKRVVYQENARSRTGATRFRHLIESHFERLVDNDVGIFHSRLQQLDE